MSAKIINFDDHHPDFATRGELKPSIGMQIYCGGIYLGGICLAPEIMAYSDEWEPLGTFPDIDGATRAVLASGQVQIPSA